jgi:hypothetical protein
MRTIGSDGRNPPCSLHCLCTICRCQSVAFIATMMDSGVEFVAVDNPHATRLTLRPKRIPRALAACLNSLTSSESSGKLTELVLNAVRDSK